MKSNNYNHKGIEVFEFDTQDTGAVIEEMKKEGYGHVAKYCTVIPKLVGLVFSNSLERAKKNALDSIDSEQVGDGAVALSPFSKGISVNTGPKREEKNLQGYMLGIFRKV